MDTLDVSRAISDDVSRNVTNGRSSGPGPGGGPGVVSLSDFMLTLETGNNGDTLTTTHLSDTTVIRADRANIGTWTIVEDAAGDLQIVSDAPSHIVPIRIPNTTATSGTRGFRANLSAGASFNYAQITLRAPRDRVSFGFFVTLPTATNGNSLDLLNVLGSANMSMQMDWTGSGGELKLHTGNPSQFYTPALAITAGTRYWVTMLFDRTNGLCKMNVYTDTGTLLASQELGSLTSIINGPATVLRFGRCDGISQPTVPDPAWTTYTDIIVDLEDATFPLGVAGEAAGDDLVEGYLFADDMVHTAVPVAWSTQAGTPNWGGGAGGTLRVVSLSNAKAHIADAPNVYVYGVFNVVTLANSKKFLFFYAPNGTTEVFSIGTSFNGKPQWYVGATGTMGGTLVQGTTYHIWMEWVSGTSCRAFISTTGTKPTIPDANWALEDTTGVATSDIGSIFLSGCSTCDWTKFRISNSVIGSNPD